MGQYTVQPGDTLSNIANKFGISLGDLEAANPQIKNPDLIHPGDVINIPDHNDGHGHHSNNELGPGANQQLIHFKQEIENASRITGAPASLIAAMIWQESRANPNASSNNGKDTGLMQINDDTFAEMRQKHHNIGPNKNEPATNILGGSFYLADMHNQFGTWPLALRAYNSGPNAVDRNDPNNSNGIGDPNYVRFVLRFEGIIETGEGVLDP